MKHLTIITPAALTVSHVGDVDRHVSERIRRRRVFLGLTQQEMADLIGVSFQQAHKYEHGINRITAGRLYQIAQALGVEINYFFAEIGPGDRRQSHVREITPQQKMLVELARDFTSIRSSELQEAVCRMTKGLSRGRSAA